MAAVVVGETPGNNTEPMRTEEEKATPQTGWDEMDDAPIDFTIAPDVPLPPIEGETLPTNLLLPKPKSGGSDPVPMRIEGHTYWHQAKGGSSPQEWVFKKADEQGHKVCIVLQGQSRRYYASFTNVQAFWAYYRSFQGPRSFYWINRSHGL